MLRFGTDGVRGVANLDLTPELVLSLGRAAARVLGGWRFVVGRDTRRSGPLLEAALVAGLAAEGVDVITLGVAPTPAVAWLAAADGVAGAMISASHNPFADNGVKLFAAGGAKLTDEVEAALEAELHTLLQHQDLGPARTGDAVGEVVHQPAAVQRWVAAVRS
ncbi:MAG: phosphoglucosamine mutase, partial [Acidimicrobiales bacterium]|nr:phosphoglucosamine mutase [Acidimicrobiales bacterium]